MDGGIAERQDPSKIESNMKTIGLDVGSTTLKCVVLDENENIV